ncbi:MAG: hypothetical protein V5A44_00890 [Haloarculaceae archaeon]
MNTRLANNLGGPAIVKSFDRYEVERGRVAEQSGAYRDEKIDAITVRKAFFSSLRLLVGAMFVTTLVVGGTTAITAGGLTAGAVVTYFMYLRYLDGPMTRIGKTANNYQKAKSSAERVFGVLGYEADVRTPEDGHAPTAVDGGVTFDDVEFSYSEDGEATEPPHTTKARAATPRAPAPATGVRGLTGRNGGIGPGQNPVQRRPPVAGESVIKCGCAVRPTVWNSPGTATPRGRLPSTAQPCSSTPSSTTRRRTSNRPTSTPTSCS